MSLQLVVARATVGYFSDGTATCSVTPNLGASGVSCSSDERLKKNIESISDLDSLEKILQLHTVTYEWKNIDNGRHTGYIAQEVEKLAPEFVNTDSRGYKQVSYTGFIPWITGAIKALYISTQEQGRSIASMQNEKVDRSEAEIKMKKIEVEIDQLRTENALLKAYICQKDPISSLCSQAK